MSLRLPIVLAVLGLAAPSARADQLAAEYDHFGAAILDVYLHQQQNVWHVFNSQSSQRITQSSEARRLQFDWRFRPEALLTVGFLFPVRDETIREGDKEIERYHYPKQLLVGCGWDALRVPLSKRGTFEVGLTAGVLAGLARPFADELLPWAEGDARVALASGSALVAGLQYAGLVTRGSWAFVLGGSQRF